MTGSCQHSLRECVGCEVARIEADKREAMEKEIGRSVPFLCYLCGERPFEAGLCRDHLARLDVAFPNGASNEARAWWLVSHLQQQRNDLAESVEILSQATTK